MTVKEIIERVNKLKDNDLDDDFKVKYIEDVDKKLFNELILTHENPITTETFDERYPLSQDSVLLAPDEYSGIYEFYVIAQIDTYNAEYERYTNNMYRYNAELSTYQAWYHRNHMPKGVKYLITD